MKLAWREAATRDATVLAEWNHQLIQDEGHRNPMTIPQLVERMQTWLASDYRAVIFSEEQPVGYALFREEMDQVYLRQMFVRRDRRRNGVGSAAFQILRDAIWPPTSRLTVEVLCRNPAATSFWRKVGYSDYSLTLEILPRPTPAP